MPEENNSQGELERFVTTQFDALRNSIGERVSITYVDYGNRYRIVGELVDVCDFLYVEVGIDSLFRERDGTSVLLPSPGMEKLPHQVRSTRSIPFIGYGSAIQKIDSLTGSAAGLYSNPTIPEDYDVRDLGKRREMIFVAWDKAGLAAYDVASERKMQEAREEGSEL